MAVWLREAIKYAAMLLPWALKFLKVYLDYRAAKFERNTLAKAVIRDKDIALDLRGELGLANSRTKSLRDRLQQHIEAERQRRPGTKPA